MRPFPIRVIRRVLVFAVCAALSAFFWVAFYQRYYKYRDCIDALTNSSCMTPDGNLTAGGALWSVFALFFAVLAFVFLGVALRRFLRSRRRAGG